MTTIVGVPMKAIDVPRGDAAERAAVDASADVLHLFEEHGSALYGFCRVTLARPDEAEDVVQETFLKLLRHLRAGGDRSNLRSWLFTVAANGCRDRSRGRWRWLPWREEGDLRAVEPQERVRAMGAAQAAMRALAPRDRLLLSLRAQGLSYREIAAAAGIREGSVGRLLARALDRWKRGVASRTPDGRG